MANNCRPNCECKPGSEANMGLEPTSFTDPPFEPDCRKCDGTRKVEVSVILDVDGSPHNWPRGGGVATSAAPEVDCPWCV